MGVCTQPYSEQMTPFLLNALLANLSSKKIDDAGILPLEPTIRRLEGSLLAPRDHQFNYYAHHVDQPATDLRDDLALPFAPTLVDPTTVAAMVPLYEASRSGVGYDSVHKYKQSFPRLDVDLVDNDNRDNDVSMIKRESESLVRQKEDVEKEQFTPVLQPVRRSFNPMKSLTSVRNYSSYKGAGGNWKYLRFSRSAAAGSPRYNNNVATGVKGPWGGLAAQQVE